MRRSVVAVVLLCLGVSLHRVSATSQLIVNGGFESTSANPWVLGGTTGVQVVNGTQGSGIGPYDGAQFLTMGNALGAGQYAYQTVILPTNLIAATLSLAYDVASSDPNQDDYLTFYITTAGTPPFSPIYDFGAASSASPTGGWVLLSTNFIAYPGGGTLSALAGMAVNVYFAASTDTSYVPLASFGIDDVSLTVATTADIPGNDDFTNATLVPSAGITNGVITTYASREAGEPKIGNNVGGHSVWWTWTAPSLGNVVITTAGSDFITALGVFTGSSLSSLTSVTNNNGINRGSGLANLTFPVSPGRNISSRWTGTTGNRATRCSH